MSKRTVKKEGWGISRWEGDVIASSIRNSKEECLFDFAKTTDATLDYLYGMGYECVEVKIINVDD